MEDTDSDGQIEPSLKSRGCGHRSHVEVGASSESSTCCVDIGLTRVESEVPLPAEQFEYLACSASDVQNAIALRWADVFGDKPHSGPLGAKEILKGRIEGWNR